MNTLDTVNFNDVDYHVRGTIAPDGAMRLETMSGPELAVLYNLLNSNMGINKRVNKFPDKKTAIKRVYYQLTAYEHAANMAEKKAKTPAKKKATVAGDKKPLKLRGMRFVFRPEDTIRNCRGTITSKSDDTRTLRKRAVDLLTGEGATFSQVEKMVEKFDKDRGVASKFVERRSYELVRLVHYYLGYGLKQEGNKIIAYTDPKDAPK